MIIGSLTSILAAWGAGVSSALLIRDVLRRRAQVHVLVHLGVMPSHLCDGESPPALVVTIRNRGFRAIQLVAAAIEPVSGVRIPLLPRYGEQPFPLLILRSEESHRYLECDTAAAVVDSGVAAVRFIIRDASGREYASHFVDPVSGQRVHRRATRSNLHVRIVRSA
ncbi:MAG: hypothetical protein V4550_19390 [Gemmatimonadota bacterium]